MAAGHRHIWGIAILLLSALMSLPADARAPLKAKEPQISGPGGEKVNRTGKNQVQVWSCTGGKLKTCSIRQGAEGGGEMTPSGRRSQDGQMAQLRVLYAKRVREVAVQRAYDKKHR